MPLPSTAVQGIPTVDHGVLTVRCELQTASINLESNPTEATTAASPVVVTESPSADAEPQTKGIEKKEKKNKSNKGKVEETNFSPEPAMDEKVKALDFRWTYRLHGNEQPLMITNPCTTGDRVEYYRVGTSRQIATFHGLDFTDVYILEPNNVTSLQDDQSAEPAVMCDKPIINRGVGVRISGRQKKVTIPFVGACSRFFILAVNNEVTDFLLAKPGDYEPTSTTWDCRASFHWGTREFDPIAPNPQTSLIATGCYERFVALTVQPAAITSNDRGDNATQTPTQVPHSSQSTSAETTENQEASPAQVPPYVPALGIKTQVGLLSFLCSENSKGEQIFTALLDSRQIQMGPCQGPGRWNVAMSAPSEAASDASNVLPDLPLIFSARDYTDLFLTVDAQESRQDLLALRVFDSGKVGMTRIAQSGVGSPEIKEIGFPDERRSRLVVGDASTTYTIDWRAPSESQGAGSPTGSRALICIKKPDTAEICESFEYL